MGKKKIIADGLDYLGSLIKNVKVSGETNPVNVSTIEELEKELDRIYAPNTTLQDVKIEGYNAGVEVKPIPDGESASSSFEELASEEKSGTACLPCIMSHAAACAGPLAEAVRFAREDITKPEVTERVSTCLEEITAAERGDLSPEKIQELPQSQQEIARMAAQGLREIRHGLEWFKTDEDLEKVAAEAQRLHREISRRWLLARLSQEERNIT